MDSVWSFKLLRVIKTSLGKSGISLLPTDPVSSARRTKATSHVRLAQRIVDKISNHPDLGLGESHWDMGPYLNK